MQNCNAHTRGPTYVITQTDHNKTAKLQFKPMTNLKRRLWFRNSDKKRLLACSYKRWPRIEKNDADNGKYAM